jgi:Putative auto-transporter adhesin, head GIN domain
MDLFPHLYGKAHCSTKKGIPMKRIIAITACALALPGAALAATKTYDTGAFEKVSVAAGVSVDITVGPTRSVVAETKADKFDDLRIEAKDNVLRIDRPASSWMSLGHHPDYHVHVVTPALHALDVSSGSDVKAKGAEGDFTATVSSGSDVEISQVKGGKVKVSSSSGSDLDIAGSCVSLEAEASSGSDLDAGDLKCESVSLHASSGSDMSVAASKSVTGQASSGSDIRVKGKPATVQVDTSSGAGVSVRE